MEFMNYEIRDLQRRFNGSFTDGQHLLHYLPNGLVVITLHPSYSKQISYFSLSPLEIEGSLANLSEYAKTDMHTLKCPFNCHIVDINTEISLSKMRQGPTATFIMVVRPDGKGKPTLSDNYRPVF